ncbi:hypothetical protein L1049_024086 [Liquidambar formosana]|uniref:Uncharacterized protein n=1 Tax=Liquidambar formosana TaxID=63359 RepID=A0AAP0X4H0_LIQFO
METKTLNSTTPSNPKPMKVCFSFAAYAKTVIEHLKACNIPVLEGLTDSEFSSIESAVGFTFPPDLRSVLCEGLPVGPGFPNWRSASHQQLEILTNLPILGIRKEVFRRNFWCETWGDQPADPDKALALAKRFLKKAPVLVPIYRHCYIPSSPNLAGNPVFYINGCDIRLWSFDLAGFFKKVEFSPGSVKMARQVNTPAWAATSARRVKFWSDMAEVARRCTRGWWSGELGRCLGEVFWMLRDGGWKEEEVREMMMMDGGDRERKGGGKRDKEGVVWHVRVLSLKLLRGGWSTEDVVYSLGYLGDQNGGAAVPTEENLLDFQYSKEIVKGGGVR